MKSTKDLDDLRAQLSDAIVLTVYIAAEEHDPAQRTRWRKRLDSNLDAIESTLDAVALESFRAARELLIEELRGFGGFLPAKGWVGFVTPLAVWHASLLPVPMPDMARWRRGPVLSPYLRAMKQNRQVMLALVDGRRARTMRYYQGHLTDLSEHRAHEFIEDLNDTNMAKRAVSHSGVRGETATDVAERILRRERDKLLEFVATRLLSLPDDTLIILAGPTAAVSALRNRIEPRLEERTIIDKTMHMNMSLAEILGVLEPILSEHSRESQELAIAAVIDHAGPDGKSTLGLAETRSACEYGQVDQLFMTQQFIAQHEEQAEELIACTLEHNGAIDLISDTAADRLDEIGGGVGARLRFVRRETSAFITTG